MYHTFGVAVLFWGMLLLALTRRIWRECFLPLSCVYRINKTHCLFTHSSPVHYCRINAYNLFVLAHVIYLYCICSPGVHSFCSRLRSLLQMRAYLCCLFPAGTGLKGMRAYRESMQGSKSLIWKGREGMFVAVSGLGPVFPAVFPINLAGSSK